MAERFKQDLQAAARLAARKNGLTPEETALWMGMIDTESDWNPNVVGRPTKYGTAKGVAQFTDATAKSMGIKDVFDPIEALDGSSRLFKQLLGRFGDPGLAVAAYNWNPKGVQGMIDNPGRFTPPDETAKYVPKVFKNAQKFGPAVAPTTPTLAFFPGVGQSIGDAVAASVADRTGAANLRRVENAIQTGSIPGSRASGVRGLPESNQPFPTHGTSARGDEFRPPLAAPPIPEPTLGASSAGIAASENATLAETPTPSGFLHRANLAPKAKTMDAYLKAQFGPAAAVADPFPKAYDRDLMRMIDEA